MPESQSDLGAEIGRRLAMATAQMWSVVDSIAAQWSSTAYVTGESEAGISDDGNQQALDRRDSMHQARAFLEEIRDLLT